MPDDRMLHRRQGTSAKLAQCDHLTYRVWTQYLLSADDYGLMPDEPATIRGANLALMRETEAEIRRCLDVLLSLGLLAGFRHQNQGYVCSLEWQDFQKIRYPRTSYLPTPPVEIFEKLSAKTRQLFKKKCKAKEGSNHRLTANGKRLTAKAEKGEAGEENPVALTPAALGELWNELTAKAELPKVTNVTGTRRKHTAARLAEHDDRPWWEAYFARIAASDFLCGRIARTPGHEHWACSFDWAMKPDNLDKVIGGNFDNRRGPECFSASELAQADEVLRRSFGGRCPHGDPPCETREECKRNIIRGWRQKGAA